MPLSKKEVMRRALIHFNGRTDITSTEKIQAILYCKHVANLIEKLKRDGFIVNSAIQSTGFKKEFKSVSRLQTACGNMLNNFLHLIGASSAPPLTVINPNNNNSAIFSEDAVTMALLWSYVATGELIGRFFKRFVDFRAIVNSLPRRQQKGLGNTSKEKITLNTIVLIFKKKYNTNLFKNVDMDLRNSISHYSFCFYKTTNNAGIYFYYKSQGASTKRKRYNLPRLVITSKKINLLLIAVSSTVYPLLK